MKTLLPTCLAAIVLSACANVPPTIEYDKDELAPAVRVPPPARPVEIVEIPRPVPLPGQLKPPPTRTASAATDEDLPSRVKSANTAAAVEPTVAGYLNAIQVYPYVRGALYQLYAAPGQVSDIALQPGEQLIAVSAGDTVRWVVGDTTSGAGADAQVHILVKPIAAGLTTNLVILTDRRTYHLELHSTEDTYLAAVSWHYPQDDLLALRARNAEAEAAHDLTIDSGIDLERLRFRYRIVGDDPPWRPERAFDDGNKVFIQFPERLDQGEAPPLFVIAENGETTLVNYRVRRHFYIVDRLFAAAELRMGVDPQQVVTIVRTDGVER